MEYNLMLGIAWVAVALIISILLTVFVAAFERMRYYRALFSKEKSTRKAYWNTIHQQNQRIVELKNRISNLDAEMRAAEALVDMTSMELNELEKEPYRATLEAKLKEIKELNGKLQNANALIKLLENANTEYVGYETQFTAMQDEYAFYRSTVGFYNDALKAMADSAVMMKISDSQLARWVCEEVRKKEKPASVAADTGGSIRLASEPKHQQISACV